jgi:dTMP kinase
VSESEPERRRGRFISFEGGEGSGKTTQIALLRARLELEGYAMLVSREPGGTPLGEVARTLSRKPAIARRFHRAIADVDWDATDPLAELFLMSAARAQLVGQVLLPALADGTTVVLDRYDDSTLAYQGYGRGLDLDVLRTVNAIATRGLRPDLTVLLDLPPALGLERKRGERGRDVIGDAGLSFHERVRAGYGELAAAEPERWLVLDALRSPEELAAVIWDRLALLLPLPTASGTPPSG